MSHLLFFGSNKSDKTSPDVLLLSEPLEEVGLSVPAAAGGRYADQDVTSSEG